MEVDQQRRQERKEERMHEWYTPFLQATPFSISNEAESCLAVAHVFGCFLHEIKENGHFKDTRLGIYLAVA